MVKVERTEYFLYFRTISRKGKSTGSFAIPRRAIFNLEDKPVLTLHDSGKFAVLQLDRAADRLTISFYWLNEHSDGTVIGKRENVRLSYTALTHFDADDYDPRGGNKLNLLSQKDDACPRFVFKRTENLRSVIAVPILRRNLIAFLNRNFCKPWLEEVRFFNESMPYDFFFEEVRKDGADGLFGAVILHNREKGLEQAYYVAHT